MSSTDIGNLIYRRSARLLYEQLLSEGKLINPYLELKKYLSVELLDMEALSEVLKVNVPRINVGKLTEERLRNYIEKHAELTYKTYLLVNELRKRGIKYRSEEGVI